MSLTHYFETIKDIPPLTKEVEHELFVKAKAGDERAKEKIIRSNLRFVVSVAKQYQGQGIPLEDLIGEGNYGLMKAYENFDIHRNIKFITYAVWWIRQSIINNIHELSRLIRLPANKISLVGKINKIKNEFEQDTGKPANIEELYYELSKHGIYDTLDTLLFTYVDIDKPHDTTNKTIHEIMPSKDDPPSKDVENKYLTKDIDDVLSEFTEREQEIIKMYFGIGEIRGHTLEEIGIDLGLTRERIRQIKKAVIEKLQKKHRAQRLEMHIEDD
jgi:RNA polymerase primary sigma factor